MKIWSALFAAVTAGVMCAVTVTVPCTQMGGHEGMFTASASETADHLTYEIQTGGTAIVTGCDTTVTTVEIPEEVLGAAVTGIGDSAFAQCTNLKSVRIPNSVTKIGSRAFSSSSLQMISITNASCIIENGAIGKNAVVSGWNNSTAAQYAAENGLVFMGHKKSTAATPSLGIGSVEITPAQLKAMQNTLTFEIWAENDVSFSVLSFGMKLPEELTYVSADTYTSAICIPSEKDRFVWYPLISMTEIHTTVIGSVTVSVSESAAAGGEYTITLVDENLTGSMAAVDESIPLLSNGSVKILSNGTTTTTSTSSGSNTTTTKSNQNQNQNQNQPGSTTGYVLGDVNQDGDINIFDAYQALLAYAKTSVGLSSGLSETQKKAADVDGDGTVSIYDAYRILLYYAEKSAGKTPSWS